MASSSPPTATVTSLEEIIPQLLSNIQSENYNDVLSTTTALLGQDSNNNDIIDIDLPLSDSLKKTIQQIHCRVLITLSKYTQLVDYYHKNHNGVDGDGDVSGSSSSKQERFLEYAYALYKLGRYVQCRDLIQTQLKQTSNTSGSGSTSTSTSITNKNGLMHILAQCQYRLHQTEGASNTYASILENEGDDTDEVLTNALAVHISNVTSHVSSGEKSGNSDGDNENTNNRLDDDIMEKMKQIELNNDNDSDDYLYELVYNAGTKLLLESTSLMQTKKAIEWLSIAQQKCINEHKDEDDNDSDQYQNLMPIQANIALGKMNLGDLNGSTRSYLELLLTIKKMNDKSFTGGGALLAIDNNLAVLNSMKKNNSSSVYELLKRVPELEGGGNGAATAADAASSSSSNRITPNQARTILYNRAVLFQKMNKHAECRAVLTLLQKLLTNDNDSEGMKKGKKKRKKGGKHTTDTNGQSSSSSSSVLAPVATEAEMILWNARIQLLQNEINSASSSKDASKKNATTFDDGIALIVDKIKLELQKKTTSSTSTSEMNILEYALTEVLLYQAQKKLINANDNINEDASEEKNMQLNLISTLENLPESMRTRPAIVATLCSLYSKLSMDDKVSSILESTNTKNTDGTTNGKQGKENLAEYKRLGDFKLRLGLYEEAAVIYKSILSALEEGNNSSSSSHSMGENEIMECKAGLIKAMSYFDIENAIDYAEEVSFEQETLDGEELEAMDIPRLSKGSTSGSSKLRKILANRRNAEEKQKKKKNHDAVLRRRAKKREAHLQKLQSEGKYNPDRPLKPDPERWVPKSQRSYNKRGRRGRTKFIGAQGIGSGAGAEKDAAKLDAAARAAAKAQGKDLGTQARSTAHLAVSSNGTIGKGYGKGGRRR